MTTILAGFLKGIPQTDDWQFEESPHTACNETNNLSWPCQGRGAANCTLNPCLKTFNTSMINGSVSESVLNSVDLPISQPVVATKKDCLANATGDVTSLVSTPLSADGTWVALPIPYWGAYDTPNMLPTSNDASPSSYAVLPPDCTFALSLATYWGLQGFLRGNLTGSVTAVTGNTIPATAPGSSAVMEQFFQGGNLTFESINNTFRKLADSLTTELRTNGATGGFSEPARGANLIHTTCIRVRWFWFAYPLILTIMVGAFLCAVIVKSSRYKQKIWKTSIYPAFFHGLDPVTTQPVEELETVTQMAKKAHGMRVQLDTTVDGCKLVCK